MLETQTPVRFFMGANTPGGFVGFLDDFYDSDDGWRAYLLKGGPGSGKTALMRQVLECMEARGLEAEVIVCASDPDSLDGLLFPSIRTCVLDASSPHAIEPKCWGAVEQIVNLSACMDAALLYGRTAQILEASEAAVTLQARCRKFMGAAASLLGDSRRIALECTDAAKIQRSAARIAAREFPSGSDTPGREKRRFLSAVTPQGMLVFYKTLQALCPRIYSLEDEYGGASRLLLDELRQRALDAGHDIISCVCPLFPQSGPEHLLIPSLGIGFTTSNPWHKADYPIFRRIHAARFTDAERLRLRRQLLSFNRRAARELLGEAVSIAAEAREAQSQVEKLYVDAMDNESALLLTGWLISEIEELVVDSTVRASTLLGCPVIPFIEPCPRPAAKDGDPDQGRQ